MQTKPVVPCLEGGCVKQASERGQRLEQPGHKTAETGWKVEAKLVAGCRVSQSIPCTGVHVVSCCCFSMLILKPEIFFAALERWLVGTLKSSCFSGFRGLRTVALGIQREQISGTPCFNWAGLFARWYFLSWQMEMEISKCWKIIPVDIFFF